VAGPTVVEERSGAIEAGDSGGEGGNDSGGEVAGPTMVEERNEASRGEGKKKATWRRAHRHMCMTRGI
jgi:hypothetical protein